MSLIFLASIISTPLQSQSVDDPFLKTELFQEGLAYPNGPIPPNPFPSTINFPFSHCSNAPPSLLTATPPHGFKTKCASLCNQSAQLTECSNIYNSLSLQETLLSKFCNKIISISGQNFKITERGRFAFLFPTIKLSVTQRTSSHKKCHKKLVSQKIVVPKNGCYKKMGVTKMGVTKK